MILPPSSRTTPRGTRHWIAVSALVLGLGLGTNAGAASQDPPSRAGRIARVHGDATLYLPSDGGRRDRRDGREGWDARDTEPVAHPLNWPVTRGQRLVTEDGASAEISIGPVRVRLDARTDLRVVDLDNDQIRLDLRRGTLAVLMTESDDARDIEILLDRARIRPRGRGLFRLDLDPDQDPIISVETGSVSVIQPDNSLTVRAGQTLQWQADGDWRRVAPRWDAFARWAMQDDLPRPPRYVSSDTTGFEDLDRHGHWEPTRAWGMAWFPDAIEPSWAPYTQGRWTWVSPWGWTWIDAAPWGFATTHYGRWIQDRGRWGWLPDDIGGPVLYAPAMVTWTQQAPPMEHRHPHTRQAEFAPGYFWTPLQPNERYQYQPLILPQRTIQGERGEHDARRRAPPGRHEIRAEGIQLAPALRLPAAAPVLPPAPAAPVTIIQPARPVITPATPMIAPRPATPAAVPMAPTAAPAIPAIQPARPVILPAAPVAKPAQPAAPASPATTQSAPAPEIKKDERRHHHQEDNR